MNIKIVGSGSIGNHLAHACRRMDWNVSIFDIDTKALKRTKNDIYPKRYGKWDSNINLLEKENLIEDEFDIIIIGTPPETHISLALKNLKYKPKALLIEKPLSSPDLSKLKELLVLAKKCKTKIFVGYDHLLAKSFSNLVSILKTKSIGKIKTIDVNFREHWGGIFKAHHWLNGPKDTYLGYMKRGGGALCEHSHALSMWLYLSKELDLGSVQEVTANQKIYTKGDLEYDEISFLTLKTQKGFIGRVTQDVVTKPIEKNAIIIGEEGTVELKLATTDTFDRIILNNNSKTDVLKKFKKTRPDDFLEEVKHISDCIKNRNILSPISLYHGVEVMLIIEAAFKSAKVGKTIKVKSILSKIS